MSDSLSHSNPPDASQRKRIVIATAMVVVVIMGFAFFSGDKKTPPKKDTEQDVAVGFVQDGTDFQFGAGAPDDWLNAPEGMVLAENSSTEPAPKPGVWVSSVVTGDDPAANPLPSSSTAIATTAPAPASQTFPPADARPSSGPAPAAPVSNPPVASPASSAPPTAAAPTTPTTVKPMGSVRAKTVAEQPATTAASSAPPPASSAVADLPAKNSTPPHAAKSQAATVTKDSPPNTAESDKVAHSSHAPEFVRPTTKKSGVIAQTRVLVSEAQFHQPSNTGKASGAPAKSPPPSKTNKPAASTPVRVRQEEARAYAQQTTERLRQEKVLTPAQQARLPRSSEAPSTRIWREDDTPTTADERRPFGLVIEDKAPSFTPEGIPLRTDIPAGKSPLEKTGADKPLWKRPE